MKKNHRNKGTRGRPAKYPEAKVLAAQAGISYGHALKIAKGERAGPLSAQCAKIRAAIAAKPHVSET